MKLWKAAASAISDSGYGKPKFVSIVALGTRKTKGCLTNTICVKAFDLLPSPLLHPVSSLSISLFWHIDAHNVEAKLYYLILRNLKNVLVRYSFKWFFFSKCHNRHLNVEYKRNHWCLRWIPHPQPIRIHPSDWTDCNNWFQSPTKIKSQKYCWPEKYRKIM